MEAHEPTVEPDAGGPADGACDRRAIYIGFDDAEVLDQAEVALAEDPRCHIYQRGHTLVRVLDSAALASSRLVRSLSEDGPVIEEAPRPWVRERLSAAARWYRRRAASSGTSELRVNVPARFAEQILARGAWTRFPVLTGIVESPTLRQDGSLLLEPGYDAQSGLLHRPSIAFPPIPESPSFDDAEKALTRLLDPFDEFPFVAGSDRATFVAALLTRVARFAVDGPAPLFFFRATTPESGKTLLIKAIELIASGRMPALRFNTREPAETRKALFSIALAGARFIGVDNVVGEFGDEVWAMALTTGTVTDRILGENKGTSTPAASLLGATFFATGNNVVFRKDCGRRVLPCDIDPGVEDPSARPEFRIQDLPTYVREHRAELLVAALTILRAFIAARRPQHERRRMGSFEEWDRFIRATCIWIGVGDPVEGRVRIRSEGDADLDALRAAVTAWAGAFGDTSRTAAEVIERCKTDAALRGALESFADASERRPLSTQTLGYALRAAKRRVVEGCRLEPAGESGGCARWRLASVIQGPRVPPTGGCGASS